MKGRVMEVLKEYSGVVTALITVVAALGALGFVGHQCPGYARDKPVGRAN